MKRLFFLSFLLLAMAAVGWGQIQISPSFLPNGSINSQYSVQLSATGGAPFQTGNGYQWTYLANGNPPPGLTLGFQTGLLSGTPTQTGTFQFAIRATDSQSQSAINNYSLNVNSSSGTVSITTSFVPGAVIGQTYTPFQFTATGGNGSYSWSQGSALPNGLTLSQGGVLSGFPTGPANNSFVFVVNVQDSAGSPGTRTFSMSVSGTGSGFHITTTFVPTGQTGVTYNSFQFQAANAFGQVVNGSWSVTSGQIPPGLQFANTGLLYGTPTNVGSFSFNVQAFDPQTGSTDTRFFTMQVNTTGTGAVQITTQSVPNAVYLSGYGFQFSSTACVGVCSWSVIGSAFPPTGLTLSSNGVLSGTPNQLGTYGFTVQVYDTQTAATDTRSFTMQVNTTGTGTVRITTTAVPNAAAGTFYSFQFSATGCNVCGWTLASGTGSLPFGLIFNSNGVLSGTPTQQGVFTFTVQVTDQSFSTFSSGTDVQTFTIRVTSGQLSLLEQTLPFGIQGQAYSATLHGVGGSGFYSYSLGSTGVQGLTIDSVAGTISGTPTNAGSFILPVTVTDSSGSNFTFRYSLFIATPLSILTAALPNSSVGANYNQTLQAGGGQGPYGWTVSKGTLPAGLTLDRTSGRISGAPTANGKFDFTISLVDAGNRTATKDFEIVIGTPLSVTTTSVPDGAVGVQYSVTLATAGGQPPVTWAITSDSKLPGGLTLSTAGVISGSPTSSGTFSFTVVATDSINFTAQQTLSMNVVNPVSITTLLVVDGVAGAPYLQAFGATGGTPPYGWSVTGGALPGGLSLNGANGSVSGMPSAAGSFTFTVQVKDSLGQTATNTFTIKIIQALSITSGDFSGAVGAAFNQSLGATGGTGPYTFSAAGLPAGLSLNGSTGAITGTPSASGGIGVTLTVTDSAGRTATKNITINVLGPPSINVAPGVPNTTLPSQQAPVTATLSGAYPADISGTLAISFASGAANGRGDQGIRFSNGGTQVSFNIPQGQTAATFQNAPGLSILTGTTAGTIVLTTTLTAGGFTLPAPTPRRITVDGGPPVLTLAQDRSLPLLQQGSGMVTVNFDGYSLTGELGNCVFHFSSATGSSLTTSDFTVPMTATFASWMANAVSTATGTNFFASVPFTIGNGAASSIVSVTVSCNNGRGNSNTLAP